MKKISKRSKSIPKEKTQKLSFSLPKLSPNEIKEKIENDPDFIHNPKYNNSLKQFLDSKSKAKEHQISRFLKMPKKEIAKIFRNSLKKLKQFLEQ